MSIGRLRYNLIVDVKKRYKFYNLIVDVKKDINFSGI